MERLQALYDSEINFKISTFWDAGFDWELGDEMNGIKASGCSPSLQECINELSRAVRLHFPNSDYAKTNQD